MNLQENFGTRFFVPTFLMKKNYNYFVKLPQEIDLESGTQSSFTEDCVICMNSLLTNNENIGNKNNEISNPYLNRLKLKKNYFMKTPCNHKFHNKCLINWMTIKMECPTCRERLPPLY